MGRPLGYEEQVSLLAESTYGEYAPPIDGTSAIAHTTLKIDFDKPFKTRADHRHNTRSAKENIEGMQTSKATLEKYLLPSGVSGQSPDDIALWEHFFSAGIVTPAASKSVVSSTAIGITVQAGGGASFADESFILVKSAATGLSQIRFIKVIAGDVLTITPKWDTNPVLGDTCYPLIHQTLRKLPATPGSVSMTRTWVGKLQEAIQGFVANSLEVKFNHDGEAIVTYEGEGSGVMRAGLDILLGEMYGQATILGSLAGPYNIQVGVNDAISISIDGGAVQNFILSPGAAQTRANVVADLIGLVGGVASDGVTGVQIVSSTVLGTGSIQLFAIANPCYATLGFTAGQGNWDVRVPCTNPDFFAAGIDPNYDTSPEGLRIKIDTEEMEIESVVRGANGYIIVTRKVNATAIAAHAIAASILPISYTPIISGSPVAGIRGGVWLGSGAAAIAIEATNFSIKIINNVDMHRKIGLPGPCSFDYGYREVQLKFKLHFDTSYFDVYGYSFQDIKAEMLLQIGNLDTKCAAFYMPELSFKVPPQFPDTVDKEIQLDIEAKCMDSTGAEIELKACFA